MKLVLFGATGGIGKHLVAQALERGHWVTAVARRPAAISLTHPRLTVLQGDVYDPAQVAAAVRNQDVVLSALGSKTPGQDDPVASTGARNMLLAMREAGIQRIIAISSIGVGDPQEYPWWVRALLINIAFKTFAPHQYADVNAMERELRGSDAAWVIVRPTTLTNGRLRGRYQLSTDSKRGIRYYISRADVAGAMLTLAETARHTREILHLGY